jgi:hypothetical protein
MTCIFKNLRSENYMLIAPRTLKANDVRFEVVTAVLKMIYDCVGMYIGVWVPAFWRSKKNGLS